MRENIRSFFFIEIRDKKDLFAKAKKKKKSKKSGMMLILELKQVFWKI